MRQKYITQPDHEATVENGTLFLVMTLCSRWQVSHFGGINFRVFQKLLEARPGFIGTHLLDYGTPSTFCLAETRPGVANNIVLPERIADTQKHVYTVAARHVHKFGWLLDGRGICLSGLPHTHRQLWRVQNNTLWPNTLRKQHRAPRAIWYMRCEQEPSLYPPPPLFQNTTKCLT